MCPIFKDRINKNSMGIKKGSHKSNWFYFSEYQGYDGKENNFSNVQYEIPKNLIKNIKLYFLQLKK